MLARFFYRREDISRFNFAYARRLTQIPHSMKVRRTRLPFGRCHEALNYAIIVSVKKATGRRSAKASD